MKKVIADTNVFLRFLLNDIPKQADRAERLFNNAKTGKIKLYIPQIIVFEIHFALEKYYLLPKEVILDKLKTLVSTTHFVLQDREVFMKALEVYNNTNISFVDAYLLSLVKLEDFELFSFDSKLLKTS